MDTVPHVFSAKDYTPGVYAQDPSMVSWCRLLPNPLNKVILSSCGRQGCGRTRANGGAGNAAGPQTIGTGPARSQ